MEIKESPGWGRATLIREISNRSLHRGAEIGVQSGEYSIQLLQAGVRELYLADLWAQQAGYFDIANVDNAHHYSNLRETLTRLAPFDFGIHILLGLSAIVAAQVPDETLDFIYVDANHKLEAVRADLAAWYPKVRTGGLISGHDYLDSENCCGSEFGVKTAVRELCGKIGVAEIFVCQDEPFPNWHFFKP